MNENSLQPITKVSTTEVSIIKALWDIALTVDAEEMRQAVNNVNRLYWNWSKMIIPFVLEKAIKEGKIIEE